MKIWGNGFKVIFASDTIEVAIPNIAREGLLCEGSA
jgi:hypothetical protein